ncbi:hypothetical protein N0K08_03985 [Acidovorax sp. Be4]|uniref:Uncharacterized protein n=1 Tax=Acidovorax bellezanensis TaxID=2976702 RepID=A0ABT2PHV5_9BURK|nr:hypothetical protein [Acidovorax sp. Be4]MCT9809780.1 hypothetical protein [Acidovorax sp. Be4]
MTKKITENIEVNDDFTPLSLAKNSLFTRLIAMHRLLLPERDESDFKISFLDPQLRREKSANEIRKWISDAEELKHYTSGKQIGKAGQETAIRLVLYVASCAFFAKTIIADVEERPEDEIWSHVVESNYFLGCLQGRTSVKTVHSQSALGLDSRHQENRAMKAEVFAWLDANMARFKSMDSAAKAIAVKVAPVEFRTARNWVGQWKKLPSTGTP